MSQFASLGCRTFFFEYLAYSNMDHLTKVAQIKFFSACSAFFSHEILKLTVMYVPFDQDVFADPFYRYIMYPVRLFKPPE